MFHERRQQFSCDECEEFIPKSTPVRFADGRHFCKPECYRRYLDRKEEDQAWDEALRYIVGAGEE